MLIALIWLFSVRGDPNKSMSVFVSFAYMVRFVQFVCWGLCVYQRLKGSIVLLKYLLLR